jgi:hypothetical protein
VNSNTADQPFFDPDLTWNELEVAALAEIERLRGKVEGLVTYLVAVNDILTAPSTAEDKVKGLNAFIPTMPQNEVDWK